MKARARAKESSYRSKPEVYMAERLSGLVQSGEVDSFLYEAMRFRVGMSGSAFYTPDFVVIYTDGSIEVIEVKVAYRDRKTGKPCYWNTHGSAPRSRANIQAAAMLYPFFNWAAYHWQPWSRSWHREEF